MVNRIKALCRSGRVQMAAVLAAVLAVLAGPASATVTPSFDYTTAVTGAQAQIVADIGSILPTLFIFLGVMLVVRWCWKKFARSARSA